MRHLLLGAAFAALVVSSASANQLTNGGFESPALAVNTFNTISPGNEPVGFAWTVVTGDVDQAHLPLTTLGINFNAFEGNQGIDLNGNQPGAVRQSFVTVPGQQYALSFAYCDNPLTANLATASVSVQDVSSLNSLLSDSVSHSTSTPTVADYSLYSQSFTAQGPLTRVTFTSTSADVGSSGGLFLDAVDVSPVPEPASLTILALAAAAGLTRRRLRQ